MVMDIRGYTQMNVDLERVPDVKPALTGIAIALYFFFDISRFSRFYE